MSTNYLLSHFLFSVSRAISRNGAVVLNKKQYCYYCEKPQLKLARHLTSLHQNESTVAQVIAQKNMGKNDISVLNTEWDF